ncbi:MAG: hypothetical protein GXO42_00380 [bacterium]|nr:hypothetical protein [bacterium]
MHKHFLLLTFFVFLLQVSALVVEIKPAGRQALALHFSRLPANFTGARLNSLFAEYGVPCKVLNFSDNTLVVTCSSFNVTGRCIDYALSFAVDLHDKVNKLVFLAWKNYKPVLVVLENCSQVAYGWACSQFTVNLSGKTELTLTLSGNSSKYELTEVEYCNFSKPAAKNSSTTLPPPPPLPSHKLSLLQRFIIIAGIIAVAVYFLIIRPRRRR